MHKTKERIDDCVHQTGMYDKFRIIEEILMGFAESIAKLAADVNALIAQNGNEPAAIAAAVAAKDASDAAAVDAIDVTVAAALVPVTTPAPAAPAAPAA
jgi:hypothetical protein